METATAMEKDAAFYDAVKALVTEVKKRDDSRPNNRQVAAAYVIEELGLGLQDIGSIAGTSLEDPRRRGRGRPQRG